jgi:MoaA/NifB/PqqE/SkfB family radical SAM enzyme
MDKKDTVRQAKRDERNKTENCYAISDGELKLSFDAGIQKALGIEPNAEFRIVAHPDRVELFPNIHSLGKLYIEPTSNCNLNCRTCIRHSWNEKTGNMDWSVFQLIVEQLKEFPHVHTVMFGGFGEPTFHPDILDMIGSISAMDIKTEMVTNGTLLNEPMIRGFYKNKLDTLWVSFDGTSEENFDDLRRGASFAGVVKNLSLLNGMAVEFDHPINIGIAFVVMKQNIQDLKNLKQLALRVGATKISVSNVLPYSKHMAKDMVCTNTIAQSKRRGFNNDSDISISLPLIDGKHMTEEVNLSALLREYDSVSILTNKIGVESNRCRFIKDRVSVIRWNGDITPCMGLIHQYKQYMSTANLERNVEPYVLGSVRQRTLKEVWNSGEYRAFRERVDRFDFSPCHSCGGCNLSATNQEDCFGNEFPTCGGCLWAQGVIQCP